MDLTYDLGLVELVICRQPAGRGVGDDGRWLKGRPLSGFLLVDVRRRCRQKGERRSLTMRLAASAPLLLHVVFIVTDGSSSG